jgi:amino acid permease
MAIGATTAMISVLLNLILGLSRTIVAMSRRGDLPAVFMRLNRSQTTPYYAVMITGCLIALLAGLTTIRMTWSLGLRRDTCKIVPLWKNHAQTHIIIAKIVKDYLLLKVN